MVMASRINNFFNKISLKLSKIQFLNGNMLKILAMLIMLIDHFTKSFVMDNYYSISNMLNMYGNQLYNVLKTSYWPFANVGFSIFCFLLVEGFLHTKHLKKYFFLLFLFAIISEIPYDVAFFKNEMSVLGTYPFYFEYQNVFFTLLLGLTTMWGIDKLSKIYKDSINDKIVLVVLSGLLIAFTSILAEKLLTDYGAYGVLLITVLYLTRSNRLYQMLSYLTLFLIFKHFIFIPQLIFCLLIMLYNGKRGKLNIKYFGYIFYPAHLVLLYILSLISFW